MKIRIQMVTLFSCLSFWLCSFFSVYASALVSDEFLETLAARDRAYVSLDGAPDPKSMRHHYDRFFDAGVALPATLNLVDLSRRDRVRLFTHILNRNIRKIYDALPAAHISAAGIFTGAKTAPAALFNAGGALEHYFSSPTNVTYVGKKKFTAKFGARLTVILNPRPTPHQHGSCWMNFKSTRKEILVDTYPKLHTRLGRNAGRTLAEIKSKVRYIRKTTKSFQDHLNILLLLSDLEISRRYVYRLGSLDQVLEHVPFVTAIYMAPSLKICLDCWQNQERTLITYADGTIGLEPLTRLHMEERKKRVRRIVSRYLDSLTKGVLG